jgi:FtsP/CotA-like multicopper oxidase with cupredoxin domain
MPVAFSAAPPSPGTTSVTRLAEAPGPVDDRFTLTARPAMIGGHRALTFGGTVPGPELRVRQGDRVQVTLVNHLDVGTTIHWHGIGVPNAADGVAGITQDAVPPGGTYTYRFTAQDAGTYWYHSHQDTGDQVPDGLFGALVVTPRSPLPETRDDTLILHTMPGTARHAVNGSTRPLHLAARPGDLVRLRIVNALAPDMDGGPQAVEVVGAPYRVVALDGHDLHAPGELGPELLRLGMGQRADVVLTMPASGAVEVLDRTVQGELSGLQRVSGGDGLSGPPVTLGDGAAPKAPAHAPVFDPTRYGTPAPDPVATARPAATYPLVLDKHPGLRDGTVQLVHTINAAASPYVPPITVREGEVVRLRFVNRTGEYHPMHLHGHVMSVLSVDGRPVSGSPLHLDTVLVGPGQTVVVQFAADDPGIWMLHCHVLLHAHMGMSMTIDYAGVSTPFTMGSRSGNDPE